MVSAGVGARRPVALMPRAAIDIGSNTILLTVLDDADAVLIDEMTVVGLGRGLGERGAFAKDRMALADTTLARYVEIARANGVEPWTIRAVATSAARRAMNAETFFARIQRDLGVRIRIVSGDEEARLTWIGSQRDLPAADGVRLAIDLGGGSTELILGEGEQTMRRASLEIGTVRLTEAHLTSRGVVPDRYDSAGVAALRKRVDIEVEQFVMDPTPRSVVGTAGTVTTLAAMKLGLDRYVAAAVHGSTLDRVDLSRFIDRLGAADAAERRHLAAVSVERADYLLAGAVVLERILAASRAPYLLVSDRGLRFGLLV